MKLRSGRISALAAAVLALGALTGVTGAGAASAATPPYSHLCVDATPIAGCAYPDGLNHDIEMRAVTVTGTSTTNWVHPTVNGKSAEISQANVNLCMQLNNAGGNVVRGATCNEGQAEMWKNVFHNGRTEFQSVWSINNLATVLCLTEDTVSSSAIVNAEPCGDPNFVAYQQWGSS